MLSSSVLRPRDVPVVPDASEAQQWAIDELARSVYSTEPSLWERLLRWLGRQLGSLFSGTTSATSTVVVLVIIAALIAAVVIVTMYRGKLRGNRAVGARGDRSATLFDDTRSSEDLWRDARAAASSGRWSAACLDGYRGIVRSLDERVLLDETPGMTAHEAGLAGTTIFPELGAGWTWGGDLFDSIAYGDRAANETDWNSLTRFASEVEKAKPARKLAVAQ